MHYISNSGHDERGQYRNGKAGDQTGGEWCLRSYYVYPYGGGWKCVLRHPNRKVGETIADLHTKAAKNNNVGYDMNQRNTYWPQLVKAGYDPSKIKTPCEADCSKGVCDHVRATGYILGISALKNHKATYTGDMRKELKKAGFIVLTDKKYLTSPDYLLPGDILLNDNYHTAVNITQGKKAGGSASFREPAAELKIPGTCTVTLKQFLVGAEDPQVKTIQRILNALGYTGKDGKPLTVDGKNGPNTSFAISAFQKNKGMKDINFGTVAEKTWKALLNAN